MPFTKGKSGNPKGRPRRGASLAEELRRLLTHKTEDGVPGRRALAAALIKEALGGNIVAIKEVYDRLDGKVPALQEVRDITDHEEQERRANQALLEAEGGPLAIQRVLARMGQGDDQDPNA